MKKPITDEKFYITGIPNDEKKIRELLSFLSNPYSDWFIISVLHRARGILFWSENGYSFSEPRIPKSDLHIEITYNDLMANYLPKDTVLNDAVDEALKEVSKNEDKLNKVKNPNSTHYEIWNGFEAIDIIKNTLSKDEYIGYLKGNILKYQLRVGKKTTDYEGISKDLEKLKDYQNELNEILGVKK